VTLHFAKVSLLLSLIVTLMGAGKPKASAPGAAAPAGPTIGRGTACMSDFANPAGTNGYLSADGKLLYLLAAKPAAVSPATPSPTASAAPAATPGAPGAPAAAPPPKVNGITLYRVDLTTNKATAVLSVKQRPTSILVNHGDPIQGISALAFQQVPGGCSEGKAAGVNLGFDKKEGSASLLGKGSYGVVRSQQGTLMVDLDRRTILETDIQSYQTRSAANFAEGEVPVFFDQGDRHMVTWNAKARGMSLFKSGMKTADQKIQIKPGDRVLQDRDRFAVMAMDRATNTLTVRLLPKWSKVDKDREYAVKVPAAYNIADAYVEVNMARGLLAVSAVPGPQRLRWQKLYLFSLKSGRLLATLEGTANQYFEYFALAPDGTFLVAEVRDLNDRTSRSIRKLELKKMKPVTIDLPGPQI